MHDLVELLSCRGNNEVEIPSLIKTNHIKSRIALNLNCDLKDTFHYFSK